jgi:hypothetical protein
MNLIEALGYLAVNGVITPEERDFLGRSCASRGKNKGYVRASKPSGNSDVGVWRSTMSSCNVQRAGLFALMMAGEEERAAFDAAEALWKRIFGNVSNVRTFLGILMPYKYNTIAHSMKCDDAAVKRALHYLVKWDKERRARIEKPVRIVITGLRVEVVVGGEGRGEKTFDSTSRRDLAVEKLEDSYYNDGHEDVSVIDVIP